VTTYALDDIDRQIIKFLAENGRTSNREIARRLDLTEGTIRARIKRLEADEIVRVAAVVNVSRLPKSVVAFLRIEVAPHFLVSDVVKNIAELPATTIVASLIGRADVFAITYVKDGADLADFVHNTLYKIPGVLWVEYSVAYQIIKHDYRFTPGL
jgi:Lrp/AsnC family transcriptional regulator for asnA, asnC and gidA